MNAGGGCDNCGKAGYLKPVKNGDIEKTIFPIEEGG
jgi:hypothetical protein